MFTEGWDRAWVSPPPGGGGAPRQGWLNSFDGVFYRLAVGTYGYAHNFLDNGNQNSGLLQFYLPLNQRFEVRLDFPVVSNRGATGTDYETNFGDLQIVPRFLLSESRDFTQSFNVAFRLPTGQTDNVNGAAAITPTYEFWANWWQGLVLAGAPDSSFRMAIKASTRSAPARRSSPISRPAITSPLTPPRRSAISCSIYRPTSSRRSMAPARTRCRSRPAAGPTSGTTGICSWEVEVPVTHDKAFDYQVLGALMKVF